MKVKVLYVETYGEDDTDWKLDWVIIKTKRGCIHESDPNFGTLRDAAINIYLKGKGLKRTIQVWDKLIKPKLKMWGVGVPPNGAESNDMPPMNPEGVEDDVAQGEVGKFG